MFAHLTRLFSHLPFSKMSRMLLMVVLAMFPRASEVRKPWCAVMMTLLKERSLASSSSWSGWR